MIDISSERVMSLAEVAKELPRRRRGKKVPASTVYKWSLASCRGVRPGTIQVGGTRCTSREALQRFYETLSAAHEGRGSSPQTQAVVPAMRTAARRMRAAEEAGRKLAKLGA